MSPNNNQQDVTTLPPPVSLPLASGPHTSGNGESADHDFRQPNPLRGPRAALLMLGLLSLVITLVAVGFFLVQRSRGRLGYNSQMSAWIAGVHAAVMILGAVALSRSVQSRMCLTGAKLLASFLIFGSAVIYLELGAGLRHLREPPRNTPYESAPDIGWRMRGNFDGYFGGAPLQTNPDGHRSPTIAETKPEGTTRVVCLGDSLTFGFGVEERFAFPQLLQRLLNERLAQRRWEVINTGVSGYCTFQQTAELRRCLKYRPDLVVLLFCLNDVTEKYIALRSFGGTGLGYQGVADGAASWIFQQLVAVRRYSSLVTALTPTRVDAERREAYAVENLWKTPDAAHVHAAWTQAEKELDELVELCRAEGLGLLIAVAPYQGQYALGAEADVPQRRLAEFARARGVAFVDLKPGLARLSRAAGHAPERLYLDQSHFNTSGNLAIAEILLEQFKGVQHDAAAAAADWDKVLSRILPPDGREP